MALPGITPTENSGFIPEIFLGTALGRLRSYLTLQRTVTMAEDLPTGETFSVGKVLHLPKRGSLTVNDKTPSGTYSVQSPQSSTVDLTLAYQKEVTFALDSQAIAFQNQDVAQGYITDGIIAIAESIDTVIATAIQSAANATTVQSNTTAGYLSEDNILTARKYLVDNKVLRGQEKFAVISTTNTNALLKIDRFTKYQDLGVTNDITDAKIGNGVISMEGALGRVHGFEVAESQLLDVDGSPATCPNFFYARDAVLMATRSLPLPQAGTGALGTVMTDPETGITMRLVKSWNSSYGAEVVTIDILFGVSMMRPEHAYLWKTAA